MGSQKVHQETESDWAPFGLSSTLRLRSARAHGRGQTRRELMAEGRPRVKVEPNKKPEEDFLRGHNCLITEID